MATVEVKNLNYETPYRAVDFVDAQIEHLRPKLPKFLADRVPRVNPEVILSFLLTFFHHDG